MPPRFLTVKSFDGVPIEQGVNTPSFLEASEGLMTMFDLFGSAVFSFVQADLRSNIAGVRARYTSHVDNSQTLETLVVSERSEDHRHGTACLVRLVRGLSFTCSALQEAQRDEKAELHVCFRRAYDKVLKHHHSFVIRSVVTLAIRAVPHRADFFKALAEGEEHGKLMEEMHKWLSALDDIVQRLSKFLHEGNHGRV